MKREAFIKSRVEEITALLEQKERQWFRWRGRYGRERFLRLEDLHKSLLEWMARDPLYIRWEECIDGWAVQVCTKDSTGKQVILGGVLCHDMETFNKVFDRLDDLVHRVARFRKPS